METIKDLDQHTVCTADPYNGVIERICGRGRERILIYLPLAGRSRLPWRETARSFVAKGIPFSA